MFERLKAKGWSSPHTFIRYFSLDSDSTPGSQVLQGWSGISPCSQLSVQKHSLVGQAFSSGVATFILSFNNVKPWCALSSTRKGTFQVMSVNWIPERVQPILGWRVNMCFRNQLTQNVLIASIHDVPSSSLLRKLGYIRNLRHSLLSLEG